MIGELLGPDADRLVPVKKVRSLGNSGWQILGFCLLQILPCLHLFWIHAGGCTPLGSNSKSACRAVLKANNA